MKKSAISIVVISSLLASISLVQAQNAASPTVAPTAFSDVALDRTDAKAIETLKADGIIQGYSDGTFKPESEMTRAEFVKILIAPITGKLDPVDAATGAIDPANLNNPNRQNCFADVKNEWFAPYICEAKARGVVSGVGDGKYFKPGNKIKFTEASKIITNTYNLSKGQPDSAIWFKPFVEALANQKDIPLTIDYFDENVTRGESAEMIYRIHDKVTNKASRNFNEINGDGLVQANSCVDFQNRYAEQIKSRQSGSDMYLMEAVGVPSPAPMAPATDSVMNSAQKSATSGAGSSAASDYSSTNVQVQGVDEADIVKNDGQYIYTIKGRTVRVVQAYPANAMKELAQISIDPDQNFYPKEMYVSVNKLIVVGQSGGYFYPMMKMAQPAVGFTSMPYYRSTQKTKLVIVDITNHAQPSIVRRVDFDGNYNTSRRVGDTVYMVMNDYPSFPYFYQQERTESELNAENFLPKMKDSRAGKEELIVPCSGIKMFPKSASYNFLITAAVPVENLSQSVQREVVVGNVEHVYASTNNLYVAATDYTGGYYFAPESVQKTALYKFALGNGTIKFAGSGNVAGTVLNQFSMDEDAAQNVRIATTQMEYYPGPVPMIDGAGTTMPVRWTEPKISNNVFVLNSAMKQIGSVRGIAPGENIYSARFIGGRGYLVTFKQIDPLFVIDLSVPTAPRILGELKIPGYSNYLHPYDENHLIGFGKMVDESIDADKVHSPSAVYYTAVQGMKVGFFDVTNVAAPKQMFSEIIGARGTDSELLNNHKALLFDKVKGLMAFPITVYEGSGSADNYYNTPVFEGAYVYRVGLSDGFKLQGKIAHADAATAIDAASAAIKRVLYIGENLYTISNAMVKANALSDLHELGSLVLKTLGDESGTDGLKPEPMPIPLAL